jgi:hypothetical protein
VSENRSQMSEGRLRLWNKPQWWDSTPPHLRDLRREYPGWDWSKYDDAAEQPQAQDTTEREDARLEQRSPDDDFLDGENGAQKWNKTRRL